MRPAAEEPSGQYWRQLAESRQCALDEALSENQRLHERLETAQQEIRLLRDVVQQAEGVMAAVQVSGGARLLFSFPGRYLLGSYEL